MKYAVIGKQLHTYAYALEVSDQTAAIGLKGKVRGFEPMFVIDFDNRSIKRLVRDESGEFQIIDDAYNDSIGKHTTTEQLMEMQEITE